MHKRRTAQTRMVAYEQYVVAFAHWSCKCDLWDIHKIHLPDIPQACAKLFKIPSRRKSFACKQCITFNLQVYPQIGMWFIAWHVLICKTFVPNYFEILPCIKELQSQHKWLSCVTFTFEIRTWFFSATYLNILSNYMNIILCSTELQSRHKSSGHRHSYVSALWAFSGLTIVSLWATPLVSIVSVRQMVQF